MTTINNTESFLVSLIIMFPVAVENHPSLLSVNRSATFSYACPALLLRESTRCRSRYFSS